MKNDKSMTPLISIIMATYNDKPKYINKAIESIINQTYTNIELIIVDDSTDENSKSAIDKYGSDSRVHIYRNEYKIGFVPSLNKGINLSKGDYIARMDGDDISMLDRIEKQVKYFDMHPSIDIIGGQVEIINEIDKVVGFRKYPINAISFFSFFLVRNPFAHSAVMFRRKIIDDGYRYDESLPKAEDLDFWIRLYNAGYKFNNIPDKILHFRVGSEFIEKRVTNHENEYYAIKVRRKNFTWKKPLFSLANFIMSYVRQWTPDKLKIARYEKENKSIKVG